jgi:hypothetical protein
MLSKVIYTGNCLKEKGAFLRKCVRKTLKDTDWNEVIREEDEAGKTKDRMDRTVDIWACSSNGSSVITVSGFETESKSAKNFAGGTRDLFA